MRKKMFQTLFITILSSCYQTSLQLGNRKHDHILELYSMRNLMKKYLIKIHQYPNHLHQMSVRKTPFDNNLCHHTLSDMLSNNKSETTLRLEMRYQGLRQNVFILTLISVGFLEVRFMVVLR